MKSVSLLKHKISAPGLRLFGLGPKFRPVKGISQLKKLFDIESFWARGRNEKDIRKMLRNSSSIVTLWKENELIGFGRATSDWLYRGVLWDIIIAKEFQHSGYGKMLVNSLLTSNSIKNVENVYLMTTNCQEFYSSCGFKEIKHQSLLIKNKSINKIDII